MHACGGHRRTPRNFGPEGDAVVYFRNAQEAAQRARALLSDTCERERLAKCVHRRIVDGAHTYTDRLITMLKIGSDQRRQNITNVNSRASSSIY